MVEDRRDWLTTDPRPDLDEDAGLWAILLGLAYDVDGEDPGGLAAALNGFRCMGARLELRNGTARLSAGDMLTYAGDRVRWLVPHRRTLSALLRRVAEGSRVRMMSV